MDIDLQKCLSINLKPASEKLKAEPSEQVLPVLLNLKEVNFDSLGVIIDSKIDLVCVIDISGSMSLDHRIDYVQHTIKQLLEYLRDGHRLAIVLFSDKAKTWLNFKLVNNPASIAKINEIIDSIDPYGGTNITAGVHEAQRLLGRRKSKNHISCIFLLSDGQHNEGPINMDLLYKNDLQRAKCEYTLTSFGYGNSHDARLMQEMSERKGGNYYFIWDIKKVGGCFVDSLAMVTSIIGQNLRARLKLRPTPLFPEIRFLRTFGPYWESESPIEAKVAMSSFYAGFNKNFLCLLGFNAVKEDLEDDEPLELIVADLELKIDTLTSPPVTKTFSRAIKLTILPQNSEEVIIEDEEVEEQITRVEGAEAIERAEELTQAKNYDQAIDSLDFFVAKLMKKKFCQKELFVRMIDSIEVQKQMIANDRAGTANKYKTINFSMQTKNIFMNEQAAPQWNQGLYQNNKMVKMSGIFG